MVRVSYIYHHINPFLRVHIILAWCLLELSCNDLLKVGRSDLLKMGRNDLLTRQTWMGGKLQTRRDPASKCVVPVM